MYYPDELVEEIRSRNDIVDVISGYVKLQKRGDRYFGLCPFHNEKTPSFSVSPDRQMYYCFGCGAGGNVITFLMEYENESFQEALKTLADRAGIRLPEEGADSQQREQADRRSRILEINKAAANFFYRQLFSGEGEHAYAYLKNRGVSDNTIRRFGLGYAPKTGSALTAFLKSKGYSDAILKESGLVTVEERGARDKFWNRVMFPIMDTNNRVIGFGGRVLGDAKPKYMNSPDTPAFDKSRNLYGLNYAKTSRARQMLLCEGYMDVIALQQAGFTNAVASLGTAFTAGQAALLKRYTTQVILTYDNDTAGVTASLRAIPILREAGISAKVLDMTPCNDPDEFIKTKGADALRERLSKARNSFLFEIDVLKAGYDLSDPEQQTAFYNETAKKLASFQEPLERDNYVQAVSREQGIPYEELKRLVNRMGNMQQAGVAAREPAAAARRKKRGPESGVRDSQKLLLSWLLEKPELYKNIEGVIGPEDFEGDLYRKTADILFAQLKKGSVNPAAILDAFINDEDEYKEVAALLNAPVREPPDREGREKALTETVYRIRKNSLEQKSRDVTDVVELQRLIREQAALKTLRISCD